MLDLFPVPEFLLLSSSGIAFSDSAVRFIQFRKAKSGRGLELLHCGESVLPLGIVETGFIKDAVALSKGLEDFHGHYGVRFTRATLPEEKAYLFTTIVDKVPYENLRDAVAFTIEENAPVSLAKSAFDFEIIKEYRDKGQVKVAVSVLPLKVVKAYTAVLEQGGITPISFDIESQAIARAVIERGDLRTQLIINLSEAKTGLYVVEDEVVQFTSTTPLGTKGAPNYPDLGDLKSEIWKLFAFWNTRLDKDGIPEKKIEKIIICGAGASEEAFVRELVSGIPVEYELANVWRNALSLKSRLPELSFKESLSYAAAVGLALKRRIFNYV